MPGAKRARFVADRETTDTQELYRALTAVPKRDFAKLNAAINGFASLLHKQRRALSTMLIADTWRISEPRLLVITGHLYFEYILNLLLQRKGLRVRRDTFGAKLQYAEQNRLLSPIFVASLRSLNQLRNNYAHELFFDIAAWDPFRDPLHGRPRVVHSSAAVAAGGV
jgi:hypothetical protein